MVPASVPVPDGMPVFFVSVHAYTHTHTCIRKHTYETNHIHSVTQGDEECQRAYHGFKVHKDKFRLVKDLSAAGAVMAVAA